jgi:glucokinase
MRILGERLGVGVANVVNIFDPELVIIGGGVSRAGELLLVPTKESAARFIIKGVGTRTRIELARYGPQAGVRGAALLAGQELEREELPLQAETKES